MRITVLIISDREIAGRWLESIINANQNMSVIGVVTSWSDSLLDALDLTPGLVIISVASSGPRVFELCKMIRMRSASTRMLVVSANPQAEEAVSFLMRGATGYVSEGTTAEEMVNCAHSVARGGLALQGIPTGTAEALRPASGPIGTPSSLKLSDLSQRELDILAQLKLGKTNREIARNLSISASTVTWHLSRIYTKLGVAGRTEAAILFTRSALDGDAR